MAEWRTNGRALLRDEQVVGMVDSPEIALEIVEALNASSEPTRAPESGRERSPEPKEFEPDFEPMTWDEFDRIEAKARREATRFGLCGRCTTRTPLDRYGRLIAHRRELVLGQPEVCPGTGEIDPVITFAAWLLGAVLRAVVDGARKFRKIYREG